jgi:hypothetical protein
VRQDVRVGGRAGCYVINRGARIPIPGNKGQVQIIEGI